MGKKSGVDNIAIWAKKAGVQLNDAQAMAVLNQVKLRSHDLKRVLTEEEFKEILNRMEAGR